MGFLRGHGCDSPHGIWGAWCIQDATAVPPPPPSETLTIGKPAQFLLLMGMFYEPVGRLHGINQTVVTGLAAAKRVFEILEMEGTEDLQKGERLGEVHGEIEFKDVTFRYDEHRPIVTGINVMVGARQTVAFVLGRPGAGGRARSFNC